MIIKIVLSFSFCKHNPKLKLKRLKREVKPVDLLHTIKNSELTHLFVNGNFGLEKEGLRATLPFDLATTMHPESLGDREVNPHIKTDYSESQPEIITPPLAPYTNAHSWLQSLSKVLSACLLEDEYMWPFSVPCQLPEEQLINISMTTNPELEAYRLYTAARYGKKRQLVSGIHINYSFEERFLEHLFAEMKTIETVEELRDELYLKLASNFLRYQWLLIYLFGATPIAETDFFDAPFFKDKTLPTKPMRSLRKSQFGFINDPKVVVRFDSIEHYAGDLQEAVATGVLKKEREYYGDVRLRGKVKDTSSLLEDGIQYLEFRSFDNNPYQISGLSMETLQLVHLFFLTMITLPDMASPEETEKGNDLTRLVAQENPLMKTVLYDEGIWLCEQMAHVVAELGLETSYADLIADAISQLNHPEQTIAGRIITAINNNSSLLELGYALGVAHKNEILAYNGMPGFEHLEPAQAQHLFHIIQMGLDIPLDYIKEEHLVV